VSQRSLEDLVLVLDIKNHTGKKSHSLYISVEINIALLQMVYGVGVQTKRGRCFEFWQELMQCTQEAELPRIDCRPQIEDYLECLHRTKEVRSIFKSNCELEAEND
jgi:hypothetical protein